MKSFPTYCFSLCVLAFSGCLAAAQLPRAGNAAPQNTVPAQPITTLKASARIVVLDVVVTDLKGNLFHHVLNRDDFTVRERGDPQTIRSFEPPSEHQMPASDKAIVNSAADLKKIGDAPVTLLVLDELNSRFEDMSFARHMMVKYLTSQPTVLKQPTALMIAENYTFHQVHDYTQNRDELLEVVKKHIPQYPTQLMNSRKGGPGAVERIGQVLAALQQIAQASSGTSGRKNLIWVGNGFPSVDLISLDVKETDTITAAVRRVTARLLAARVTLYTINPMAGSTEIIDVASPDDINTAGDTNGLDPSAGTVAFNNFATSTGGYAFAGRNDLANVIGEGIDRGQEYYTISYSPTDKSDDPAKFRNIEVVMKDPELRATTRNGYFPANEADLNPVMDSAMDSKQVMANLKLDISAALGSTVSYNGLTVTTVHVKDVFVVHVANAGVGWSPAGTDGAQHNESTLAIGWYNAKGKMIGHVAAEQTAPRDGHSDVVTFRLAAPVSADATRIRIVVRDTYSGRIGTVDLAGNGR
jgi:VWFA-related protein